MLIMYYLALGPELLLAAGCPFSSGFAVSGLEPTAVCSPCLCFSEMQEKDYVSSFPHPLFDPNSYSLGSKPLLDANAGTRALPCDTAK